MPAVRARSLALASLRLVHDTLAITLSLSHPRSDVRIFPLVSGSPTQVALRPTSPAYPSRDSAHARVASSLIPCSPFATPRAEGARTDPLASPGVHRRGGVRKCRAGVARVEGADAPTVPLANAGMALGVGLVSRAEEGWAVRAVPPLACVGGAGLDAPSVLLRTQAGRGAWGWVGVARAEGWAHRPSSRECGRGTWGWAGVTRAEEGWAAGRTVRPLAYAGRAGRVGLGWRGPRGGVGAPSLLSRMRAERGGAGVACAEGDRGGHAVLRAPAGRGWGAAGPRERGDLDTGEGPARPLCVQRGGSGQCGGRREGEEGDEGGGRREERGWVYWCQNWQGWVQLWTLWRMSPRSRGPAAPRPLPAGARRTACPPQSPSAQATPAPPRPACVRKRTDGASSPAPPTHARGGTARTAQPSSARDTSPTPSAMPAFARGTVGASAPSARATPARHLRTPPRLCTPGDARGSVRAPSARGVLPPGYTPRPRRGACKGEGRTHAREGATRNEGQCNPSASGVARRVCGRGGAERNPGGGAAHERKDTHIGARVRKGESDGEGVVNEAKRSRGEAARANGGHPAPVDRLSRKNHVK
ncbi:hypothetical protein EDB83DRAFT_2315466 [Lactarius deliciosus]|nr:hypothetical protein EDB83DRAFT_2315466 [Lactarius deliciosus]